jgi:alkylhydroperoxidase/carboxymuconolactone decarboxylase family protein YurZ
VSSSAEGNARKRLWHLATDEAPRFTGPTPLDAPGRLDDRTTALVCIAALVATGAGPISYQRQVTRALAAGATAEEVLGTMLAVAPTVGLAHLVSATVGLASGLGYDIEQALESLDSGSGSPTLRPR